MEEYLKGAGPAAVHHKGPKGVAQTEILIHDPSGHQVCFGQRTAPCAINIKNRSNQTPTLCATGSNHSLPKPDEVLHVFPCALIWEIRTEVLAFVPEVHEVVLHDGEFADLACKPATPSGEYHGEEATEDVEKAASALVPHIWRDRREPGHLFLRVHEQPRMVQLCPPTVRCEGDEKEVVDHSDKLHTQGFLDDVTSGLLHEQEVDAGDCNYHGNGQADNRDREQQHNLQPPVQPEDCHPISF